MLCFVAISCGFGICISRRLTANLLPLALLAIAVKCCLCKDDGDKEIIGGRFHFQPLFKHFNESQCAPPSKAPLAVPIPYQSYIEFIPDLQVDILYPLHGQVLPVNPPALSISFQVSLTPGVHVPKVSLEEDEKAWLSLAKGSGTSICFSLDGYAPPPCMPYSAFVVGGGGDGGVGLPDDLEAGWHELSIWVEAFGLRIGGCGDLGGRGSTKFYVGGSASSLCDSGCFDHDGGGEGVDWLTIKNRTAVSQEGAGEGIEVSFRVVSAATSSFPSTDARPQ